jgi:hypothetical protein
MRITPENPDSTASSATRSTTSSVIETFHQVGHQLKSDAVVGAGTMAQFRVITTTAEQWPPPTEVGDQIVG